MFGLLMHSLFNYKLIKTVDFLIIARFRHSNIIYNTLTKSLLIDNSLKKGFRNGTKKKTIKR